jgi:small subunit ribosomal protein S16
MKKMGRKHRMFFRIVAIDGRQPRDGRVIEELGSYDPKVHDTNSRVTLKPDRVKYWLSVGAQPSERCQVLFKKYMKKFEQQAVAQAAQPTT